MRYQLLKLTKGHSTKAERKFAERLKANHIPFRIKIKIKEREVDFIVGNYAIDIDGHEQDGLKNHMLADSGFIPIHIDNNFVNKININFLKQK
jgi:very-short-patch-repair endonuclease